MEKQPVCMIGHIIQATSTTTNIIAVQPVYIDNSVQQWSSIESVRDTDRPPRHTHDTPMACTSPIRPPMFLPVFTAGQGHGSYVVSVKLWMHRAPPYSLSDRGASGVCYTYKYSSVTKSACTIERLQELASLHRFHPERLHEVPSCGCC